MVDKYYCRLNEPKTKVQRKEEQNIRFGSKVQNVYEIHSNNTMIQKEQDSLPLKNTRSFMHTFISVLPAGSYGH